MDYIAAINANANHLVKLKVRKRRNRGPKPRGPKPQVCDLCQLRKVKCDKVLPRCSFCQKMNKPCTYDRNGFYDEASSNNYNSIKFISGSQTNVFYSMKSRLSANFTINSLINTSRYKLVLHPDGRYSYFGPSMATYYFTNSSHLFNDLISNSRIVTYSKKYSGDIKIEITPTITLQLIELYFAHLNNFFPLINPTSFYSQLNNAKKHDHPFLALLNIVCLSGASYYPNRTVARIISTYYASKVQTYFKKIYLKPSLNSIQAYLLASYHISLCENDTVIENAWYYLGLAKRMLSIFYYQSSPIRSQHVNSSFENQSWIMFCCEAILSYSFGRPNYITQDETSLSKAKFYLPSVNFTAANIFLVKELASLDPTLNLKFFKQFCYHCIFLSQWSILKDNYGLGNGSKLRLNYESKQQLLNDSIKNHVYLLENEAIRWYLRLPRFDSGRTNPDAMQLPNGKDIHKSYLAALHFSFLIDLNKPFITKAQTVGLAVPIGDSLSLEDYYSKNSLERCLLCAFFGTQVVMDSNERIVEIAIPFFWYCALQFTFIFVYVIRNFEKNHWALNPSRKNGLFLYRLIEKYSDKWVLTRDTFQIVQSILVEGESFFFN